MVFKEIKAFTETEFEHIIRRTNSCMKSGDKHDNGFGKIGVVPFCCGVLFCPSCLPHRVSDTNDKFGWMKDESKYGFKILSDNIIQTTDDVNNGFDMLLHWRNNLSALSWYRVALTSKHIVVIYKHEDKEACETLKSFSDFSVNDFLVEYVDYTGLIDIDAQETLVVDHKGKRRILGRGRTPPKHLKRIELCVDDTTSKKLYALRRKSTVIPKEEMDKLPKAIKRPVQSLIYAVAEEVELNYLQLLQAYITGEYKDEYEQYLGKFDSQLNKRWFLTLGNKTGDTFILFKDYKFLIPVLQTWYPKLKIS